MFRKNRSTSAGSTRSDKRKSKGGPKPGAKPKGPPPRAAGPSRLKLWWRGRRERHGAAVKRWACISLVVLFVCAVGAIAMRTMERHVLARRAPGPCEFRLRMVDRPTWMPDSLARHLVLELTPAASGLYDPDLPEKVHRLAQGNAWVRKVTSVRRCPSADTSVALIEFRAEYRKPITVIQTPYGPEYLSADGIHLPRHQVPRYVTRVKRADGSQRQVCFVDPESVPPGVRAWPIHYIRIHGVRNINPPGYGRLWGGEDMAAGLRMVALVADQPYANQIAIADVRNFAGRLRQDGEPHLRYYARVDNGDTTDIRFGRFPRPGGDHIIPTEQKLSHLNAYVARRKGRLAGLNDYIDLRFDELHVSNY